MRTGIEDTAVGSEGELENSMSKVTKRIEQLNKRYAALADSLTALAVEYGEEIEALELKLKEAKSRIKSGRLSDSEQKYYKILSAGLKVENPLSVLSRLFLTEQVTADLWRVLGSDRETWHMIDGELTSCTCPRFAVKHNCAHLDAVRLLTLLKFRRNVDVTFGVQK